MKDPILWEMKLVLLGHQDSFRRHDCSIQGQAWQARPVKAAESHVRPFQFSYLHTQNTLHFVGVYPLGSSISFLTHFSKGFEALQVLRPKQLTLPGLTWH